MSSMARPRLTTSRLLTHAGIEVAWYECFTTHDALAGCSSPAGQHRLICSFVDSAGMTVDTLVLS